MDINEAREIAKKHDSETGWDHCEPDPDQHEAECYSANGFISGYESRDKEVEYLRNVIKRQDEQWDKLHAMAIEMYEEWKKYLSTPSGGK